MKRFSLLLSLIVVAALGTAERFNFTRLGLEDGLSHSRIYAITQDATGYLWIGTSNGLNRYDGREFTVYKHDPDDDRSLPRNYVTSVLEDSSGRLWVGTEGGGVARFDRSEGVFIRYSASSPDPNRRIGDDHVWGILEDDDGHIWLATQFGGLTRISRDDSEVQVYDTGVSNSNVWPMVRDLNGDLWIGTDGGGLNRYVPDTDRFVHYRHDAARPDSLSSDEVFSLFVDSAGTLWVGTAGGGLNRFDRRSETFVSFRHDSSDPQSLSNDTVRSIFEDSFGNFWVGTTDGLNLMDRETGSFTRYYHEPGNTRTLSNSRVQTIFQDWSGVVWFGTRDGLTKYVNTKFEPVYIDASGEAIPRANDVRSLAFGGSERAAGSFRGLNLLGDGGQRTLFPNDIVYAVVPAPGGGWFVGTDQGAFFLEDDETPQQLFSGVTNDLYLQGGEVLWIASEYKGLLRYELETGSLTVFSASSPTVTRLSSDSVTAVSEGTGGVLYLATRGGGLNHIDLRTFEVRQYPRLLDPYIFCLLPASDGTLYLGTDVHGLVRLHPAEDRFEYFSERQGLPSNVVHGLEEDAEGLLWISTIRGLARLNPNTSEISSFGVEDGLPGLIYNPRASAKDEQGNVYFGSTEGIVRIDPADVTLDPYAAEFDVRLFDGIGTEAAPLDPHKTVRLTPARSFLRVEMSGFDYKFPERIHYAYLLEGVSADWVDLGNQGRVTFSNLAPRSYSLRLRVSNSDGVWNPTESIVNFTVIPPLGLRWYMFVVYAAVIAVAVYVYLATKTASHRRIIREQEALVESRTAELREATEELESAIAQKSTFFVNLAHETKTPLTFIQNSLDRYTRRHGDDEDLDILRHHIGKLVRDMVNFLDAEKLGRNAMLYDHRQVTNLSDLVSHKLEILRSSAARKNVHISGTLEDDAFVQADPFALDRVVNNLLDNALKYNRYGGFIDVELAVTPGHVLLRVADTGRGMPEDQIETIFEPYHQLSNRKGAHQGIGMGMFIVKRILTSLGAEIEVTSAPGEGSTFTVRFAPSAAVEPDPADDAPAVPAPFFNVRPDYDLSDSEVREDRKNLLLVDDETEMLHFLKEGLADRYNLFLADDGTTALEKLEIIPEPDLIISDVMMSGLDGHGFLAALRESELAHVPFIFLSAKTQADERLQGLHEGAMDFIRKPFKLEELIAKIDAVLATQERRAQSLLKAVESRIVDSLHGIREDAEPAAARTRKLETLADRAGLSPREREILAAVALGRSQKDLAAGLSISVRTAEKHLYNIYRKCGVANRLELMNLIEGR